VRDGLRARAPAAPVRLHAGPEGDAAHVLARAVPEARRRAARLDHRSGAEDDFRETLEVVEAVGYDGAFTFVYSPRAGTDAAAMADQVSDEIKRDRIERLVELVQTLAAARNAERVGRIEEVLVEGPSRTDPALVRGRTRRNTTVNFTGEAAPGDLVDVVIERATSTTLAGSQVAVAVA
jgi:tRNA-2-methylthio-N6-dimethylallyladenosine synthase